MLQRESVTGNEALSKNVINEAVVNGSTTPEANKTILLEELVSVLKNVPTFNNEDEFLSFLEDQNIEFSKVRVLKKEQVQGIILLALNNKNSPKNIICVKKPESFFMLK